nr:LysE family transporter [Arthrobacter roseus]
MISFTPGAGAINTMSNSLNAGYTRAIWGITGQQLALIAHILIVAAGVGVLVAGSPLAFNIIRYGGAAYLVYLGIQKFRERAELNNDAVVLHYHEPRFSMFRRGLWVNLLNPKAIVFFLAFMPQFIKPDQPLIPQYLVLTGTVVVVDVLVMWLFFAAAAKTFQRLTRNAHGQKILNRIFGGLFVAVGVGLAAV